MRIATLIGAGAIAIGLGLTACSGGLPGVGGDKVTGDDVIAEAQKTMEQLKGQYVVAMGLLDEVKSRVETVTALDESVVTKHLRVDAVVTSFKDCFEESTYVVEGAQKEAVQFANAASSFNSRAAYKDVAQTKKMVDNALSEVKACGPESLANAKRFPKKATDETKAYVDNKIKEVDAIRILIKKAIPEQADALKSTASASVAKMAEATSSLAALEQNPLADKAKISENKAKLGRMKSQLESLANKATTDAGAVPGELANLTKNMTEAFSNGFGLK